MLARIVARIKAEPAVLSGVVAAAISLAVAFGFALSPEMQGGIMAATTAVLALFVRSQVSPTSQVVALEVDGQSVAGPAHPAQDGTPVDVTVTSVDPAPPV